ncbi:MAG: bifunctional riboflavin kinase/FAD synthetase [Eubacteriaceae bacterium]|nr:bifunctional riboflavin kinase/FAD synthetase [Eubacteriaceae bacterium]MDD4508206.1 bifunctional riboflavin kinase/FAD synthetase [Eubacteriaceae bacterium]
MQYNKNNDGIVMALGFFDGVHRGHQSLLKKTIDVANKKHMRACVMTFKRHPLNLIFPAYAPDMITTNEEKIVIMKKMGIDDVYLNVFNEDLMNYEPEAFIKDYLLLKYNVKHIVVGFNYTFGYKGEGTTTDLLEYGKNYGFGVSIMPPQVINGQAVSSTLIRELISTGKVSDVCPFLGRYYSIQGVVVSGKRLGHTFNIPTANLHLSEKVILPSRGVYYTKVMVRGKIYDGLTNLGHNPTFEKHPYSIETYIYDFDNNIYGEEIKVTFIKRHRGEIKFPTLDALVTQIKEDICYIDKNYRHHK